MNLDKIVYITQTPFSLRDRDRFGIDIFLKHNVEVEVLDVTEYMDPYVAKNYVLSSSSEFKFVNKISKLKNIKDYIEESTMGTVFISFIGESSMRSLRILNFLYKNNKEFGILMAGSLPVLESKDNLLNRLKLLSLKNIMRLVGKAFYLLFFNNFKYSFILASGQNSFDTIIRKYPNTHIISGHALDYDLFLQDSSNSFVKPKDNYILFLDEFFPFHPDYIRNGVDYSSFATEYYRKLSLFFDYLEKILGMEVIIGAHPRSYYDKLPDFWNGRKWIKGETINLVKNAKLCLLHASTAVNFIVLYEKPSFFITMSEIQKSNIELMLRAMAQELRSDIINLDDINSIEELKIQYSETSYKDYKEKYIKKNNTPELNNWELLYDYFKKREE